MNTDGRSPQRSGNRSRGSSRGGGGSGRRRDRRSRSRSPRGFTGRDWHLDGISNDTQRHEEHLKKSRIFVGNIDAKSVARSDLSSIFEKHGRVVAVSIHPGYSFVQMDSERSANKAINYEHGAIINGCKINVEFSSAAVKAGARFRPLPPLHQSPPPPPRDIGGSSSRSTEYPVTSPPSSYPHYPDTELAERERRLQRILVLERELQQEKGALFPSSDEYYSNTTSTARGPPINPFTSNPYGRSRSPRRGGTMGTSTSGLGGVSKRTRSLSPPPPRARTDPFASRLPSERYTANFGSRYSVGGASTGYGGDYGRSNNSSSWQ